jgi:DNA-binding response OmpR family regulator
VGITQAPYENGERPALPARVLVVVNQDAIRDLVALALDGSRFVTRRARDLPEAATVLRAWPPHLVLADLDQEDGRVLDWLSHRMHGARHVPVTVLTRRSDLPTRLSAFERGADDIVTVPVSPEELEARTLAVVRRTYRQAVSMLPAITIGELEVDILRRCARVGARELHLTSVEQSLLYLLAANAGRLLTRDEILDSLWGTDYVSGSNVVDRHVRSLRAKLDDRACRPRFIATVPGRGYRFVPMMEQAVP